MASHTVQASTAPNDAPRGDPLRDALLALVLARWITEARNVLDALAFASKHHPELCKMLVDCELRVHHVPWEEEENDALVHLMYEATSAMRTLGADA